MDLNVSIIHLPDLGPEDCGLSRGQVGWRGIERLRVTLRKKTIITTECTSISEINSYREYYL